MLGVLCNKYGDDKDALRTWILELRAETKANKKHNTHLLPLPVSPSFVALSRVVPRIIFSISPSYTRPNADDFEMMFIRPGLPPFDLIG